MIPPPDYEVSAEVLEDLEVRDREPPNYNQANEDLQKVRSRVPKTAI